jgi:cytochrome c5
MWLALFSCLPPAGLDRLPQGVAQSDTATTERSGDDSAPDQDGDSAADDSAPVGIDDSAALVPNDTAAPPASACDWMTWHNVGEPFFSTWCTACHGSGVPEEERQGAPEDCNLDSYERVVAWAPSIEAKLATGSMPPQGTPPADTKAAVLAWLECGAPE